MSVPMLRLKMLIVIHAHQAKFMPALESSLAKPMFVVIHLCQSFGRMSHDWIQR
jgi:hypothetical protein